MDQEEPVVWFVLRDWVQPEVQLLKVGVVSQLPQLIQAADVVIVSGLG